MSRKLKNVELVAIIVKVNGKKRTYTADKFYLEGWSWDGEHMSDSGVTLHLTCGKTRYRADI